jgi:hypothetical protein
MLLLLLLSVELFLHKALEFRQLVLFRNAAASAIEAGVIIVEWIIMEIAHVCLILLIFFYINIMCQLELPDPAFLTSSSSACSPAHGVDDERWSALQNCPVRQKIISRERVEPTFVRS